MNAPAVAAAPTITTQDLFVKVPQTTLPNGRVVPAFEIGQYLCSQGPDGRAVVTAEGTPWTDISYHDARRACADAGYALITESQALALALQVAREPLNWTGGAVGNGDLHQGLRNDSVDEAQPGTFVPEEVDETRGFFRPDRGPTVFDLAGNAFTWVFDDVQGDAEGLVAKPFAPGSPSIDSAPFPSMKKGVGWYPKAGADWAGNALVRGGYWYSESDAGVFRLSDAWPDSELDYVGFRCTKPIGL